ncbi:ABC transporter substrate-binding protein [Chroococcus sp. FPU101]|uniref:ABC transporter substrate-binding protein n=1 Tax=Chroococcus sp. FPU101 TaxID=1974212 RepID=UPI001A8C32C3|nr:ABC transporter substrate-binding protein [Chroococcus sp. FPU101]GFE69779.1 periplasmic binding protein [Chroococcus sp. FPU101]
MSHPSQERFFKLPFTIVVSAIAAGLFAQACTSGTNTTTTSTNTTQTAASDAGLKLGSLLPVTGDLSAVGQNMPEAVTLAVDTINACGGVNGKPVTLVKEDDQTDPAAGASAMTKLAEVDKVAGVVGSFASSVSTAAVDIAVRDQVVLISPGSTSPVFTNQAKKGEFKGFWARTAPPDTYQAQALATLAHEKGFKNVATVVINNDYGVGFEQEFVKAFEKLGGNIVDKDKPVRYDPKAATFDSEASAAFNNKPDAVAAVLYSETGSLLIQSAYKQGLLKGVTLLLTDGVQTEEFTKAVGKTQDQKSIVSGALGTVPGADGKALAAFTTLWKDKTGKEITAYVPHTWDAAVLLMLAAEAAKANTGVGIQSKLRDVANAPGIEVSDACEAIALVKKGEDINYQGASGNVDIDENGDVFGSYDVWTVKDDGSIKTIDQVTPSR